MSQISKDVFDKIRTRFSNVTLGDAEGNTTLDSDQAVFLEFDYKQQGSVVVNLQDDVMKIYFSNDMISEMDSEQSDTWHGWLRNMRKYAHSNMLNFEVKNIDKQRLDRKDFEYLVKNTGEQEEVTMESKMYGGKQKSYQDLNGARLVVKHARTVDEEKRGARSRDISAVYIENADGERFKFPNTYLPAARAMTRHISNGGYPNDERGQHIMDVMAEMMDLRKFSRRTKRQEYTEEAREIIGDATDRYYGLKNTLEAMKKQTGYEQYFENWSPSQIEVDENDLEDLKIKLTREVFDDELSDTLNNVGKASKMGKQKRMEDDERMGSEAANLKKFAASSDPIMMHPNPEAEAELRNYQMFIKNSNMPVEKRNLAMVQRIMMDLSNRMVDDALASAIGRLDMDNGSDAATAFAMAKKYLKGETETKQPKAKKDRYGKDKMESWQDFEEAIDTVLPCEHVGEDCDCDKPIREGTWALPDSEEDVKGLEDMMKNPVPLGNEGDAATTAVAKFIGDDELYDDLYAAGMEDPEGDARPIIIGWLMDHVDDYDRKYQEAMTNALLAIRKTGPDQTTMTIPRTFGVRQDRGMSKQQAKAAYNTSATQGERMGSNADDVKSNEEAPFGINPKVGVKVMKKGKEVKPTAPKIGVVSYTKGKKDKTNEGRMSDLALHIEEMIADGASNEEIKKMHPMISDSDIERMRREMDESVQEADIDLPGGSTIKDVDKPGIYKGTQKADGSYVGGKGGEAMAMSSKIVDKIEEEDPATDKEAKELFMKHASGQDKMVKRLVMKELMSMGFFGGVEGEDPKNIAPKEEVELDEAKSKNYALTVKRKVVAVGSKADMMKLKKQKGGEVYMSPSAKIGDMAEEADDMIAKMAEMAGIGSNAKSNFGIKEGEEGYQITPRSIVAREMRKLQDIAKN